VNRPAFDQILRRLTDAEVKFVVVGGLALGAWGVVRGTKDVDIVVASDPENLNAGQLGSGEQVAIETDLGRLDVVQGLDGIPSYDELYTRSTETEVLGIKVAVCSVEDLKAMKRAAGRTRDQADLEDLDAAGR
jgi:predicted nucleotidyltransferase